MVASSFFRTWVEQFVWVLGLGWWMLRVLNSRNQISCLFRETAVTSRALSATLVAESSIHVHLG